MKKILFGILIVSCFLVLIIGCGKTNPGTGGTNVNTNANANANTNTNNNFTITTTPVSGSVNVNSNTTLIINFSNPVNITNFPNTLEELIAAGLLTIEADHTAMGPTGEVLTLTWNGSHTQLALSGIETWYGFTVDGSFQPRYAPPSTPLRVHITTTGGIQDIYGQSLTPGVDVWNHTMDDDQWRYAPLINNSMTTFQVQQSPADLDPGEDPTTYEAWTILNNSGYVGYSSIEAIEITNVGDEDEYCMLIKNNRSEVLLNPELENAPPPAWNGFKMLKFPLSNNATWTDNLTMGPDTILWIFTAEATSINLPFLGGVVPCYKISMSEKENSDPWVLSNEFYFVYNVGAVRMREFDNDPPPQWIWTSEATSYTK